MSSMALGGLGLGMAGLGGAGLGGAGLGGAGLGGAAGVLASPFAAMHGLGSPLTGPYASSAVGGNNTLLFANVWLHSRRENLN